MSNKKFRLIPVLALMIALIAGSAMSVCAESYDYTDEDFHCYFDKNHKMDTNFNGETIAKSVEQLQPGDDLTFKVTYKNNAPETTYWYLENKIEQTLEKTKAAKVVSGTGKAENGGYKYELLNYSNDGSSEVLFNSIGKTLGGDEKVAGREGLEQATNALEDWLFIQELASGESGYVVLKVAFEGETEVNDYMDTDGGLNVRFAVELKDEGGNKPPKPVKTGDYSNIMMWVSILMAASVLLIIFAIISIRRDRKEGHDAKH